MPDSGIASFLVVIDLLSELLPNFVSENILFLEKKLKFFERILQPLRLSV